MNASTGKPMVVLLAYLHLNTSQRRDRKLRKQTLQMAGSEVSSLWKCNWIPSRERSNSNSVGGGDGKGSLSKRNPVIQSWFEQRVISDDVCLDRF
ncbi:Hypothetical protein NTJ_13913 [Nesidiocoris tenuis]|uniref:Uncharacterized protein n=1 Tax=Nesidiocoris tenuis TaxID=355587 RepID=A0ABN7B9M9_9HEMI|nr:Hypothetical protein NTJ_13913 [Nesidiocoris tenuis]